MLLIVVVRVLWVLGLSFVVRQSWDEKDNLIILMVALLELISTQPCFEDSNVRCIRGNSLII